jgi:GMP synthase-like glutamine amidotransferase
MKTLCVIQHTEAEYLGLFEDHFEGRNIRFAYRRPFTPGGVLPQEPGAFDGLVLLGAGPYGIVSGHLLPSMGHELRLTKAFLSKGLPVLGLGLGAVLLSVAAGGGAAEAPLRFEVEDVTASPGTAFAPHLPERFPMALYLRDMPVLPTASKVLATDSAGAPVLFSVNGNSLGCLGHPGIKRGMTEDLIMEYADTPERTAEGLERLGREQRRIAEVLSGLMVGIIRHAGLM